MQFYVGPRPHLNERRSKYLGRSYRHIQVAPLNATIGAEISGVQLADLKDAAFAEIECDLFGFALALLSCIFSGLRWALTQLLVHAVPAAGGDGASGGPGRDAARRGDAAADSGSVSGGVGPVRRSRRRYDPHSRRRRRDGARLDRAG